MIEELPIVGFCVSSHLFLISWIAFLCVVNVLCNNLSRIVDLFAVFLHSLESIVECYLVVLFNLSSHLNGGIDFSFHVVNDFLRVSINSIDHFL